MFKVSIDVSGVDRNELNAWEEELEKVYADMDIENVSVSANKITFDAGFSGMDDTKPDDIKMRLDEYLSKNEEFQKEAAGPIIVEPVNPNGNNIEGK